MCGGWGFNETLPGVVFQQTDGYDSKCNGLTQAGEWFTEEKTEGQSLGKMSPGLQESVKVCAVPRCLARRTCEREREQRKPHLQWSVGTRNGELSGPTTPGQLQTPTGREVPRIPSR